MTEYSKNRRAMFEKPVSIDVANRYIKSHRLLMTDAVKALQRVGKTFTAIADKLELGIENGIQSGFLFEDMICYRRNANFWTWLSVYVAKIEQHYGVNLLKDRDKIFLGNYPEELRDVSRKVFHYYNSLKQGRAVFLKQPDSAYNLKCKDIILIH